MEDPKQKTKQYYKEKTDTSDVPISRNIDAILSTEHFHHVP